MLFYNALHPCDVHIDNKLESSINHGILVLLGIEKDDNHDDIKYISKKILKMRIFNDNQKNMNLSVQDVDGSIMIVSQFTLCANVKREIGQAILMLCLLMKLEMYIIHFLII